MTSTSTTRSASIERSARTSAAPTKVGLEQLGAAAQAIELVRPELHHGDPLVPIFAAGIGAPHAIILHVRKLPLDRIGIEPAALVEQRCRHRAKAVGSHFLLPEAERPQRRVDGVLRHRTPVGAE